MQHYRIKSRAECTSLGGAGPKNTGHRNWLACEGSAATLMTLTAEDHHSWFVCFGCRRPRRHAVSWRRLDWHKVRLTRFCPPGADLTTFLSRPLSSLSMLSVLSVYNHLPTVLRWTVLFCNVFMMWCRSWFYCVLYVQTPVLCSGARSTVFTHLTSTTLGALQSVM